MAYSRFKLVLSHQQKLLNGYLHQLSQQQAILACIRANLPTNLQQSAQYCVISNRSILIYTEQATWASQLRFHTQAILTGLAKQFKPLLISQVQIRLLATASISKPNRIPKLPDSVTINQIATAGLLRDDALGTALISLSKTLANKTKSNPTVG